MYKFLWATHQWEKWVICPDERIIILWHLMIKVACTVQGSCGLWCLCLHDFCWRMLRLGTRSMSLELRDWHCVFGRQSWLQWSYAGSLKMSLYIMKTLKVCISEFSFCTSLCRSGSNDCVFLVVLNWSLVNSAYQSVLSTAAYVETVQMIVFSGSGKFESCQ